MAERYNHLAPASLRKAAVSLKGSLEKKPAKFIPFQSAEA